MAQTDLESKTATAFVWKDEVLVVGFLAMLAAVMLFWDIGDVPGGLHWEYYNYSFIAGLIDSGQVPANELWRELEDHSGMVFHCVLASFARRLLGIGLHTQGIAVLIGLLAFGTVLLTYGLARVCRLSRGLSFIACVLLLSSPGLLTHARSGNMPALLSTLTAVAFLALFLAAHRTQSGWHLAGSAYVFSWCYFGGYVSFPVVVIALLGTLCLGLFWLKGSLLGGRLYAFWILAFVVSVMANGVLLSVFYCHQDPLFAIRGVEQFQVGILKMLGIAGGESSAYRLSGAEMVANNCATFLRECFWAASPGYKSFVPDVPAAVLPVDILGGTLPGTPALYWPVAVLMLVGLIRTMRARRLDLLAVSLVWLTIFGLVALVLSYHGRRVVLAMPFISVTAAWGFGGLQKLSGRMGKYASGAVGVLLCGGLLAKAFWDVDVRFASYLKTLQFDVYREAGTWLRQHFEPQRDILVLTDKSTMFPTALFTETDFRPCRVAIMSEYYFPVLLASDRGNLAPPADEFYTCTMRHIRRIYRYCNLAMPTKPFDLPYAHKDAAWSAFSGLFQRAMRPGDRVYLLATLAGNQCIEAGSFQLQHFLLRELVQRDVRLEPVVSFRTDAAGNPHGIIFKMTTGNGTTFSPVSP
ncbi:MAG: hypothetical protein WA117_17465 [Verrucomicrobiia bacterium]